MKSRIRIIVPVLVIAAVVVGVVQARRAGARDGIGGAGIAGSGTVEATEVSVSAEASGRVTVLRVDEGESVESGAVIAELDHSVLDAELRRSEAAAYSARMQFAEVARGARSEEVRARAATLKEASASLAGAQAQRNIARQALDRPTELASAVDSAKTQIALAQAQLAASQAMRDEAVSGPRSEEITAARAALAQADAGLEGALAEHAQAERACTAREAATTQVTKAETELAVSQATRAAAEARRQQVENPPRPARREQLTHQIAAARSSYSLAEQNAARVTRLREADAATAQEVDAATAARDQALAGLNAAEAALADLDAGAREAERNEAAAGVAQASAGVEGARAQLGNAAQEQAVLLAQARQQLERARSTVEQAKQVRAQAAAQVQLLETGTRPERLRQADAQVSGSSAGVAGAETALANATQAHADRFPLRQQVEATEQQVGVAEAKVQAAKAQLDLALAGNTDETIQMAQGKSMEADAAVDVVKARLANCYIRAPRTGTVSEIVLREGEMVSPGATIVRMLDLSNLWVRVYLPVTRFGKVRIGATAEVRIDADPSKAYPGRVTAVSDESEFTPRNTQTVEERVKQVFWVKVGVGDGQGELKPGMPADVSLVGD